MFNKHIVYSYFIGMIVFVISMFYGPWLLEDDESIPNLYNIYINDTYVGTTRKERTAHECLQEAMADEVLAHLSQEVRLCGHRTIASGVFGCCHDFGLSTRCSCIILHVSWRLVKLLCFKIADLLSLQEYRGGCG